MSSEQYVSYVLDRHVLLVIRCVCKEWHKDWPIDICFYVHKDGRYERNLLPCNRPPKTSPDKMLHNGISHMPAAWLLL